MHRLRTTTTKAIAAGFSAGIGALGLALLDGALDITELVAAAGTGLIAYAGTLVAPANRPKP